MTAAALHQHLRAYGGLAGCLSTRRRRRRGQRTDWLHPRQLAGREPSMVGGFVRCGKAPTATVRIKRHGSITTARTRRLNCGGRARSEVIRLALETSGGRRQTSQLLADERPTPPHWNSGMNCSVWLVIAIVHSNMKNSIPHENPNSRFLLSLFPPQIPVQKGMK